MTSKWLLLFVILFKQTFEVQKVGDYNCIGSTAFFLFFVVLIYSIRDNWKYRWRSFLPSTSIIYILYQGEKVSERINSCAILSGTGMNLGVLESMNRVASVDSEKRANIAGMNEKRCNETIIYRMSYENLSIATSPKIMKILKFSTN